MKSIPIIGPIVGFLKVVAISLILATILYALLRPIISKNINAVRAYFGCFAISLLGWTLWITSYWADTGYYDTIRIPLGNDKSIVSSFGEGFAHLKHSIYNQGFTSFIVENQVLFGKLESDSSATYMIFDISKDTLLYFKNYESYRDNRFYRNPKSENSFLTPEENYFNYWGKLTWLY